MTRPLKRGDVVEITAHGTTKRAMVTIASANGRSIVVMFNGGLFWPGAEGAYVGVMPLLQTDQGDYIELINQRPVAVTRIDDESAPAPGGGQ